MLVKAMGSWFCIMCYSKSGTTWCFFHIWWCIMVTS